MTCQLVLQFKGDEPLDFDVLVNLEEKLQELVAPTADAMGHAFGSGEANVFVLTADLVATFERANRYFRMRRC